MATNTPASRSGRTGDQRQALRLTRNLMAVGTSLLVVLLLFIYRIEGYIAQVPYVVGTSLILALCGAFYLTFRSGLNLAFRDPSLTMLQVASAVAVLVYINLNLQEARGAFLLVYMMAMLFAVFRLTTRELHFIVVPVIVAHAVFIAAHEGGGTQPMRIEAVYWLVLTVVLLWFAQLGGYISNLRRRLRTATVQDELTGTFTRRHILELLEVEKSRVDRHGEALCVALLDLDRFKGINDRFGHAAGDSVLKAFARAVHGQIRTSDCFGRYGGEEFMLILAHTPLSAGIATAERVRAATAALVWSDIAADLVVTVSIGITEYRQGENADELIARADAALYAAKRGGRDRVVAAQGDIGGSTAGYAEACATDRICRSISRA